MNTQTEQNATQHSAGRSYAGTGKELAKSSADEPTNRRMGFIHAGS